MSLLFESPEERRARYSRMAIAAAAAAARMPTAEARSAYLILAETWSDLAKADEQREPSTAAARKEPTPKADISEPATSPKPGK